MRPAFHRRRAAAAALLCLGASVTFGQPAPAAALPSGPQSIPLAAASPDARRMAGWVIASRDNQDLPFVIIDKIAAQVFAFSAAGQMIGASPALLGMGLGDVSPIGIGLRKLADIKPAERITPSGRFIAGLGPDLGTKDVLWVDYDAAISLHRVFTGTPSERRLARLATPSADDNRISYGCINVPADYYETVIHPLFAGTHGIVYVMPDTRSIERVFPGLLVTPSVPAEPAGEE